MVALDASYSSDGITWTALPHASDGSDGIKFGVSYNATSVIYGSSKFVVVGTSGKASYSSDGISWTALTPGASTGIRFSTVGANSVTYGSSKFFVAGNSGYASYSVANTGPTLTSIAVAPTTPVVGSQITITPTGQSDVDTDTLNFYCKESASPTSADTLCTQANASYSSNYSTMTCTYNAIAGDGVHTIYCRAYDGSVYSGNYTTTYTIDGTVPSGGSIDYTDGDYGTASVSVTYTTGTDSVSGLNNSSGKIQRAVATLTSGNCGSFGPFSDLHTGYNDSPYVDATVLNGYCYKYQYLIADNAGNTATYTTTNIAKISIAGAPTLTSISVGSNPIKGGNQITITPAGQGSLSSSTLYYYCAETANPTSVNTLCSQANVGYDSPYNLMTCTYNVTTGDTTRTVYCRTYDGSNYSGDASNTYVVDTTAPTLAQITPVSTPTKINTPSYVFSSSEAGTISYQGDCVSASTSAIASNNTIIFDTLSNGTHSNCKIRVTDAVGNVSNWLSVSSFIVDAIAPTVSAGSNQSKNASFTQTATATDADSGINASSYQWSKVSGPGTITFGTATALSTTISASVEGSYVIQFSASDNATNITTSTFTLTWDTTVPNTVVDAGGYNFGDVNSSFPAVTTTLTCADGAGSGCSITKYCIDNNNTCTPSTTYISSITTLSDTTKYIRYYSTDYASNSETIKSVLIMGVTNLIGIDWKSYINPNMQTSNSVAYSSDLNMYIMVNYGGASYSYGGANWTNLPNYYDFTYGIKFGGDYPFTVGYLGNKFLIAGRNGHASYSFDGINWNSLTAGVDTGIKFGSTTANSVAYGAGKYIVVGNNGYASYSSDGITWTALPHASDGSDGIRFGSNTVYSVIYAQDKFIAVGQSGHASYSFDGINWNSLTAGVDTGIKFGSTTANSVAYGAGKYIVVGNNGYASYSSDGITWTALPHASDGSDGIRFAGSSANSIAYGNGKYIVVGAGPHASLSIDGINWAPFLNSDSTVGLKLTYDPVAITYGNNRFVVASGSGWLSFSPSNSEPTLTSISTSSNSIKGGSQITITPTGQGDSESDDIYYYCNETGSAISSNTLCSQANTSYTSSYGATTCVYNVASGNATRIVYCRTYDGALYSAEKTTTYMVDDTNPITTADAGSYNFGDESHSNVMVSLVCSDASGSGCFSILYCIDTDNSCTPTTPYTSPIEISTSGTSYIRYFSTDVAGNIEIAKNQIIKIVPSDSTAPITTPNGNGYTFGSWSNNDVSVSLTCDDGSGVGCASGYPKYCVDQENSCASVTNYGSQVTISDEGINYIRYLSKDVNLNTETEKSSTIKIDKTKPITVASAGSYIFGQTSAGNVTISLICSDGAGSGCSTTLYCIDTTNTCTPNLTYTASVEVSTEGISYFKYSSTDLAINSEVVKSQTIKIVKTTAPVSVSSENGGGGGIGSSGTYNPPAPVQTPAPAPLTLPVSVSAPNVVEQITEQIQNIKNQIAQQTPAKPVYPPIAESVPPAPQMVFRGGKIISKTQLEKIAILPLPDEIKNLALKFPQLATTLEKVGVNKTEDVQKLQAANLVFPGLSEASGVPTGLALNKFNNKEIEQIPTGFLFARVGNNNIDLNTNVTISKLGMPIKTINTIENKNLYLAVKPDNKAKSVIGYVVFKSANSSSAFLPWARKLSKTLSASLIGATNIKENSGEVTANKDIVLEQFNYTDNNNDGVWEATVQSPAVDGSYEIRTEINYIVTPEQKQERETISMIMVVDPEGYVYRKDGKYETRISDAKVSIYWLNPGTKKYELWPAKDFQQQNPQTTNNTGKYSFLVPIGSYYLEVESADYITYKGQIFDVAEGNGIHQNIELEYKNWFWRLFTIERILLGLAVIILMGIFVILIFKKVK